MIECGCEMTQLINDLRSRTTCPIEFSKQLSAYKEVLDRELEAAKEKASTKEHLLGMVDFILERFGRADVKVRQYAMEHVRNAFEELRLRTTEIK